MGHHHGSDMPTSARAILHHTDQKGPNIMHPSVLISLHVGKKEIELKLKHLHIVLHERTTF